MKNGNQKINSKVKAVIEDVKELKKQLEMNLQNSITSGYEVGQAGFTDSTVGENFTIRWRRSLSTKRDKYHNPKGLKLSQKVFSETQGESHTTVSNFFSYYGHCNL